MHSTASRPCYLSQGFTLFEMLVVILLTGMIATILFQGLNQIYRLQTHFDAELDHNRKDAMLADWYRQVITGLKPDQKDGQNKFSGDAQRLQGQTTSPLDLSKGVIPFVLQLRYNRQTDTTHLEYIANEKNTPLLTWAGKQGKLAYLDVGQQEYDQWPPPMVREPQQIPAAIRLDAMRDQQKWTLIATPMSPVNPKPRIQELFGK